MLSNSCPSSSSAVRHTRGLDELQRDRAAASLRHRLQPVPRETLPHAENPDHWSEVAVRDRAGEERAVGQKRARVVVGQVLDGESGRAPGGE
jgi:hypothetical protein